MLKRHKMTNANFKILVIDIDTEVLSTIKAGLKAEGFIVITSTVSRQAIQLAIEEQPQLVLLDLLMPELDGIELLSHINQTPFFFPEI